MLSKVAKLYGILLLLLLGLVGSVPALAGSAVIGSVAGSLNATVGGQALLPNTTLFSGDSLRVKDGAAVVAMGSGSRMVFGRETVASFLRELDEVTVLLGQGNVSIYHPEGQGALRVKAGDISILPAKGYKTLGEVAMVNGAVVVTAKEGLLRVEGNGPAVEVATGKTITILPKAARAPQGAAAGGASGVSTALSVGSLAGGVTSSVLSTVAISRANDAKTAATTANSTAAAAVTAANAAKASADAATTAANAAEATAFNVGCTLLAVVPEASASLPGSSDCPIFDVQ